MSYRSATITQLFRDKIIFLFHSNLSSLLSDTKAQSSISRNFQACYFYFKSAVLCTMTNHLLAKSGFFIFLVWQCLNLSRGAKQRRWLGPADFLEGQPPSKRSQLGIVSCGENLFIFGGYEVQSGESNISS